MSMLRAMLPALGMGLVTTAGFVALTAGLLGLAMGRYVPSYGPLWNVRGTGNQIFVQSGPPIDLAAQAGTTVPLLIAGALLNSAFLTVLSVAAAVGLGVPLGFWFAIHAPPRLAALARTVTNIGVALPAFFLAFLLQVVAIELTGVLGRPVVPTFGFGLDGHLVIPVVSLTAAVLAYVSRLVTIAGLDLNARDFARTARAKGLSERAVIYRHLVPNMAGALGEAVLGGTRLLLGGLVIVEYLVAWPGLGYLMLRALKVQDPVVVIVGAAVLGIIFLLLEMGLDLITERTGQVTG